MSDWQPIETAPKDGTPIQAHIPGHGDKNIIAWSFGFEDETGEDCAWVTIQGRRFRVAITDPRRWSTKKATAHGQDRENIIAPMPGKIVRVLVKPGDRVESGQGILVVEAMKMQNEMKAHRAGRIAALPAREGETVSAGAILATIE